MMSYRASVEEIEPGFLFLGNIKARDPEILNKLGIRYVLNAANADLDEMAPLPEEDFKVFTLNLLDGTQLSAEDGRVRDGLAFIDEVGGQAGSCCVATPDVPPLPLTPVRDLHLPAQAKQHGAKILVHCALGANRSTTLLLAWLLTRTPTTLAAAFRRTWRARPCVAPWPQNARFLLELEATWPVPSSLLAGKRGPEPELARTNGSASQASSNPVAVRRPSLWLWQLDPEMLKEADMLEWLARRLHMGLPLPTEA